MKSKLGLVFFYYYLNHTENETYVYAQGFLGKSSGKSFELGLFDETL